MALVDDLTNFRRDHSNKHSPAYMMYSNEVRDEIIRVKPATIDELYAIKGVRKDFVLKHGKAVLELVRHYK